MSSEDVDIELENMGGDEVEYTNPLDPARSSSIGDNGDNSILEGECSEEEDSDDDYASIQRPAFLVDGEPNFDSGPPEDGLEYLRRVRYHFWSTTTFFLSPVDDASLQYHPNYCICHERSFRIAFKL